MKRRIIKQGSGYTITLPIKWIRENNLESKDEIELTKENHNLLLSTEKKRRITKKEITLQEFNKKRVRSIISSAYKVGYEEIILHFKNSPNLTEIHTIVNTFTGLEIISSTKKTILIKSFLHVEETEIEHLIIKMFQIVKVLAESISEEWTNLNQKEIETIVKCNVIKLRDHCLRSIHTTQFQGDHSYDYHEFVTILEKISAEFYYLSQYIKKNKPKRTSLMKPTLNLLSYLYKSYLKKDYQTSNQVWDETRKFNQDHFSEEKLIETTKKEGALTSHFYHLNLLFRHLSSRLISLSS